MRVGNKWTNVVLIALGVALVPMAFLFAKESILPNAIVGLILLLRGSKVTPQPLMVCSIGIAAAMLTVLADVYVGKGGFLGVAVGSVVLILLETMVLWDKISKYSKSTSNSFL